MFQGDFLQGGCPALSWRVQQVSPCSFNLKGCRDVVHGSAPQHTAEARAEEPREPGLRVHTPCPSPGRSAASWPGLSPGRAPHALADGDT